MTAPEQRPPFDAMLTDAANAGRLVNRHRSTIRYVAEDRQWLVWDGTKWKPDTLGQVMELAKDTVLAMYTEAAEFKDDDYKRKRFVQHATSSLSANRLSAMVRLATTDPDVAVSAASLDSHIWLLNCTNGTVDLRTGELRPADPADMITKTTGVEFDPTATCSQWEAFIAWAMLGRADLVTFTHRVLGMALSGDTSERLVLFLHGIGKNGKSVTLKTVRQVVGDYGQRMQSNTLEAATFAKGGGGASDDIASLKGARFVYTSEVEDGTKLATALLKDLTGDERLRARHLYRSSFEFMPEFTPFIAANHKPLVPSDDQAVWDRLRLVPFDARVSEVDKDVRLFDKLVAESSGILAWLVRGCVDWQRHGLPTPADVVMATKDYRDEMNTFADFLDSVAENKFVDRSPTALRDQYNRWSRDGGTTDGEPMSQREFRRHMEASGWVQVKDPDGVRRWHAPKTPGPARTDFADLVRRGLREWDAMDDTERQAAIEAAEAVEQAEREAEAEEALRARREG